ncbi:MAG: GSCFA domain-containing protein [Pseudomonadota bacterium]|nr:GSCFA domain-containing protein [Pseudomonadota bacterium]
MTHPYASLPARAFWRSGVAGRSVRDVEDVWRPKFAILPTTPIATFGSCFAQHIGAALRARAFNWLQTEPPPRALSPDHAKAHGYDLFTCRTGNIYSAKMLRQWSQWALGGDPPAEEFWQSGGRWFDPFRPTVEPGGFASREEARSLRDFTRRAFARAVETAEVFVFTLGLTEGWRHRDGGYEYQICPGAREGAFDARAHTFHNADYGEILADLGAAIDAMGQANPNLKFLLTVSPVALAATASGNHVLVATTESKSILRAVAGALTRARAHVDYFPSYELVASAALAGDRFAPDRRNASPEGVAQVMDVFFAALGAAPAPAAAPGRTPQVLADARCDEELLEAFAPRD